MDASVWIERVERGVGGCLERAGWLAPPVSAIEVASRLGICVIRDSRLVTRGRCTRLDDRPVIAIAAEDRPERREWTVAHELGEIAFPELAIDHLGGVGDLADQHQLREQVANLFATRLLLPTPWFREAWLATDGDLFELKQRFPTASHELIAFRMLDAERHMVISIYDQGRLTKRRGNTGALRPPVHPLEARLFQRLHDSRRCDHIAEDGIVVDGWPVDEPGWQRDVIRLMASDE